MSVASRLKKQRKTNVWPFVLAGGGLVVFLLVAAVIVVASANSRGNIAARGDESPPVTQTGGGGGWGFSLPGVTRVPEREVVLEQWYEPERMQDFGQILRWSRPYREGKSNYILFRWKRTSGPFENVQTKVACISKDGSLEWIRDQGDTFFWHQEISWSEPGNENSPVPFDD